MFQGSCCFSFPVLRLDLNMLHIAALANSVFHCSQSNGHQVAHGVDVGLLSSVHRILNVGEDLFHVAGIGQLRKVSGRHMQQGCSCSLCFVVSPNFQTRAQVSVRLKAGVGTQQAKHIRGGFLSFHACHHVPFLQEF